MLDFGVHRFVPIKELMEDRPDVELEALRAKEQELKRIIDVSFPLRREPKIHEFINSQYIELEIIQKKIDIIVREIEAKWAAEPEERINAVDRGKLQTVDGPAALRELRSFLK